MTIKVIGFDHSWNSRMWKICAALRYINMDYEVVGIKAGKDNKTEEYLNNCHPLGRTPVLQTEEGYFFESGSILRHIARLDSKQKNPVYLYGRTMAENTQVDMWIDYILSEFTTVARFFCDVRFNRPLNGMTESITMEKMDFVLGGIERHLSIRTYLASERLTIADIQLAFELDGVIEFSTTFRDYMKKFKHIVRLYHTVMCQPFSVEVLKKHRKAKESIKQKPSVKVEMEKSKVETEKAKVEVAKPEETTKKANVTAELPPSTFVLDAFKREYSNKDTRTEAIPYLFEHYDPEGFTMYWCDYMYPEDLSKMLFMTCNLVGGWMQRMDHLRKTAFGSVLICGEESKQQITSFWIFRGKGWPAYLDDVVDTELYKWTEIKDFNAEKARIADYLAWDGETFTDSFRCLNGRVFK